MALETFFPNYESTTFEEFDEMPFHDKKFCCELLQQRNTVSAYKFYSVCDKVVINLISSTIKQNSKLESYFQYTIKNALVSNDISIKEFDWEKVSLRLMSGGKRLKSNNTDVRTCFKIDQHKFIVPPMFTFGLRTVSDGFVHLIETTSAPMCYYELNMNNIDKSVCVKESCFIKYDMNAYNGFILYPNTRYQIDSNTKYILISPQKSIFSLHVLKQPIGNCVYGQNPKQHKGYKNPANIPPPTPMPLKSTFSMPKLDEMMDQQKTNEIVLPPSPKRKCDSLDEILLNPFPKRKCEETTLDEIFLSPKINEKETNLNEIFLMSSPKSQEEKHLEELCELKMKNLFPETILKVQKSVYDYPTPSSLIIWMEVDKMFPPVKNDEFIPEPLDLSTKKSISIEEDENYVETQNLTKEQEDLLLFSDQELLGMDEFFDDNLINSLLSL